MVRDYKQRQVTDDKDEDSDSSVHSVKLYEKAFASFRPEFGESNAEAAERHRLIKERVVALKHARKQEKKVNETTPRLTTRFQTSSTLDCLINIRQHRATHRRHEFNEQQQAKYTAIQNKNNFLHPIKALETRFSVYFTKSLITLHQISMSHPILKSPNPLANIWIYGREYGLNLPPQFTKSKEAYIIGFQHWIKDMMVVNQSLKINNRSSTFSRWGERGTKDTTSLIDGTERMRRDLEQKSPNDTRRTLLQERKQTKERQRNMGYTNNTQSYIFEEESVLEHSRVTTYQIEDIMDTGATFSMLPSQFNFARRDMKPCLHTIEGCFKGSSTSEETRIGELHSLITLNNGETRRVIIPQAIAVHPQEANNHLLATTPYLLAEHRYTWTFPRPTLHFKGGGELYDEYPSWTSHHQTHANKRIRRNTTQDYHDT